MKPITLSLAILLFSCSSKKKDEKASVNYDSIKEALEQEHAKDFLASLDSVADVGKKKWVRKTFVDSFGDETKESYVEMSAQGIFSNSATVDAKLYVSLLITKNKAGLFLHEYNENAQAQKFVGAAIIMMKNEAGKTQRIVATSDWSSTGGILINKDEIGGDFDFRTFRKFLLKSKGDIKFRVQDDYSSVYNFMINTQELEEALKQL